jgi:molecular chaperone DnaK
VAELNRNGWPICVGISGRFQSEYAVGIDPKEKVPHVGQMAANLMEGSPESFIEEIKRRMGEDTTVTLGDKEYRPEEVSALILKYLKANAERFLNEPVDRLVVTVPANFNDKQRNATKRAGELAGFKVERVINEPTAAALAYGLDHQTSHNVLVYDLGGGTFDVTVLEYNSEVLDVKASAGDNQLGGKDFDKLLSDWVCTRFKADNGVDLRDDARTLYRIRKACKTAKEELSFRGVTSINLPFIAAKDGKPLSLSMDVTRAQFEDLVRARIDNTESAMRKALRDSGLEANQIDTVLLVGGSTRIPYVKEVVRRVIGKEPRSDVDPDRAVAMGAAIQAGIIDGEIDMIIMDVVPFSLGTDCSTRLHGQLVTGIYSEIIPANSPLLKEFTESYTTTYEDQHQVDVSVFQKASMADSMWAADHTLLGSQMLEGIPDGAAGEHSISVTFLYTLDGIVKVRAVVDSTGKEIAFTVRTPDFHEVSSARIDDLWQRSEKADKVKTTIAIAEAKISALGGHSLLEEQVRALKAAVVDGDDAAIGRLDNQISDTLFDMS